MGNDLPTLLGNGRKSTFPELAFKTTNTRSTVFPFGKTGELMGSLTPGIASIR
jgi:hypothetical protein